MNANLPDTALHYVPFTYVGTLDGYVLKPASGGVLDSSDKAANTTDSSAPYGHAYLHSLFIADHILTTDVSYDMLNASDFIFGNSCTVNNINYTLRAPTIGNSYAVSASQGIPENNEWDQILFKDTGFIKNFSLSTSVWNDIWTWGQDTDTSGSIIRSVRSGYNQLGGAPTRFDTHVGYRPVLELPTDLAADSLKAVALSLGGGKLGNSSEDIQIIVKAGSAFTAPAFDGLTRPDGNTGSYFMWLGSDGNLYAPGDSVPALVTTLTAQWKDSEKPTGEIIIGANKWQEFLHKLTFGLFFKDTQTVTINAADNSGTVFVSYLVTDQDLSEAELGSLVFSGYEEPFHIDPSGEYIVYAMLVDESLNITYLRSDRITLDNVQPVISGIEDGKTYCEAQTVTIDEKYVGTVTVNGTAVELDETGSFTLAPAKGGQRIVVTDKVGSTAEMTVTVNDGHTGGTATCAERAVCEVCGKAYGEPDPNSHTDLKHIPAKAATEDAEGNIKYWYCEGCNKYYSDKDGTKEITKADTVTAKLPKTPPTGDTSSLSLWLVLVLASGGAATAAAALSRKKKHDR